MAKLPGNVLKTTGLSFRDSQVRVKEKPLDMKKMFQTQSYYMMVTMIAHPDHRLPLRCAQLPGLQVPWQGLHSGNIGRVLSAYVFTTIWSRFADC